MNQKTFVLLIAIMAVMLPAALAQVQPVVLTIHVDKPVSKVSPTLYGLMTEEINYSYDGGLYAEMVRNRTFRARRRDVPYWLLVEDGNAQVKMEIDQQTGPSEALNYSLRLEATQADAENQAGVLNGGYWGMPLNPNTTYKGSFYAKADSDALGAVNIELVTDADGQALASTTVSGLTTAWKQYHFSLKTGAIQPSSANHLVLTVKHAGTLWLNLVSLYSPGVPRPRQRQPHRPDAEVGRHASGFPTFSRRKLPGGRSYSRALRVEENDRPAGGQANASQPVALQLVGWAGPFGVPGVVRRSQDAAGTCGVRRLFDGAGARKSRTGSRSLRTGHTRRTRVRNRWN